MNYIIYLINYIFLFIHITKYFINFFMENILMVRLKRFYFISYLFRFHTIYTIILYFFATFNGFMAVVFINFVQLIQNLVKVYNGIADV